jgi:hypothetical protein
VIVRPLFRSLSRPLFRALSGAVSAITKVLIDLSPTSNGFYSLGTDSVLTTAYKLGASTVLPTASTTYALFGRASSATDYLKLLSSGYLSLDVNGTVVTSTALATKDSEYREYSVTLDGNDFVFRENTTVISTVTNATAAAKTLTLNLIGNSNGANFYLGILADPVMGTLEFKLNKLTDNFEYPVNNVFGGEEVTNGDFSNGLTGWTAQAGQGAQVVGGELKCTSTSATVVLRQTIDTVAGNLYEVNWYGRRDTVTPFIQAMNETQSTELAFQNTSSATGEFKRFYFVAEGAKSVIRPTTPAGTGIAYWDNISVKSVTNVINYNNIGTGTSVRDTYTLINDDYFGGDRWGSLLIDFVAQGGGTTTAVSSTSMTTTSSGSGLRKDDALTAGNTYLINVENLVNAQVWLGLSGGSAQKLSADGEYTVTIAAGNTSIYFRGDSVGTSSANVSVKRYIEVA